ncbi:MAG TPA: site-2 protease family protein [Clostridiales bacterium]|jgi:Zn-dependent protease|nr:site-2 protease family protein [Clostridiales bacterium]
MGIREVIRNLDWSYLIKLVFSIVPALVCIIVHEISHSFVAYKLGDRTSEMQGRLSLNPLRHIDPIGLLMLAVFRFGWAKPVSVNMYNFKKPKRDMAITAFAGPLSNMLLAAFCLFLYGLLWKTLYTSSLGGTLLDLLQITAQLSVSLGVFNLIPIPPLDGSKVLFSLLPNRMYLRIMMYERFGVIFLMLILFSGVLSGPLYRITSAVYGSLFPIAIFAFKLV